MFKLLFCVLWFFLAVELSGIVLWWSIKTHESIFSHLLGELGGMVLGVIFIAAGCYVMGFLDADITPFILSSFAGALCGLPFGLPACIAKSKDKKNKSAIAALNFLAGFTFVGWVAALVWALTEDGG